MKKIITKLCVATIVCGVFQTYGALLSWTNQTSYTIPDNRPNAGALSDIYIAPSDSQLAAAGNPVSVRVADVQFTISGGWAGDYTVVLKYTDGTTSLSQTLFSSLLNGNAANGGFNNVILSSELGTDTAVPSPTSTSPLTGTFYGINFDTFQNVSPSGDWLLYVTDNQDGDQGILTQWSVGLVPVPEPVDAAMLGFVVLLAVCGTLRHFRAKRNLPVATVNQSSR